MMTEMRRAISRIFASLPSVSELLADAARFGRRCGAGSPSSVSLSSSEVLSDDLAFQE